MWAVVWAVVDTDIVILRVLLRRLGIATPDLLVPPSHRALHELNG